ncbi:MAG: alpha/beta fold hydrolase [Dehalococcoidia bacterium]|nr:alpha/beta fold hydrolase [Dehalococcoidia bacterium]
MPFASNSGIRIHYEVEGEGPSMVLQHGFTTSLEGWRAAGYVDALKGDYQLILVDARGHGASDKPHAPEAYEGTFMAGDVVAVLDDLGIDRARFWGYSMGGRIGFFLATHFPDRFHCFVLGGISPHFRPEERQDVAIGFEAMKRGGLAAYIAVRERTAGPLPPEQKARILANDAEALFAVWEAMDRTHGLWDRLPGIPVPCLLYTGGDDARFAGAKEAAAFIPRAEFFSLPGLNHGQGMARSDLVLPRVRKFLERVRVSVK